MAEFNVDLFVIGGGSGGVRAARIAAGHGARVMLAEEYRMGGTCVIRGCVPKKLLVYASHIHHEIEDAAGFGWTIPSATFDWPTLIANKDKEIARLEAAYTSNVEKSGARIVKTRAVFENAHTLRLTTGEAVKAKGMHDHYDRLSGEPDRQARQGIHLASVQWLERRFRSGDVRDRAASQCRQSRAGEGRRRDQPEQWRDRGR